MCLQLISQAGVKVAYVSSLFDKPLEASHIAVAYMLGYRVMLYQLFRLHLSYVI